MPAPRPRPLRALLAALLLALAGGALAQAYHPSESGMTWTYSSGETQVLSGPVDFEGTAVMVLTHYFEGVPVSEDYLVYDERGVVSLGTAASGRTLRYDPPLHVYAPGPLQVGQSWQSTTRLEGLELTLSSEVLGVRGVQTPAGRFNALLIRQRTVTSTGAQTVLDLYFVPSVGVVRFVGSDGTVVDLIERSF